VRAFFDSSGLAKRYIREAGSDAVDSILDEASEAAISLICPPEVISALSRLRRQSLLSSRQYEQAKAALFDDIEDMLICGITGPVIDKTIVLLEKQALRTIDALHLATAIEWPADIFVSADRRQLHAAAASGLNIRQV
jgi:predicted nucleic acid-binding protein